MTMYEVYSSLTNSKGGDTFEEIKEKTNGSEFELLFYLRTLEKLKEIKKITLKGMKPKYFKTFGTLQ